MASSMSGILVAFAVLADAAPPEVAVLLAGTRQHAEVYAGWQFEMNVTSRSGEGEPVRTKDRFKTAFVGNSRTRLMRCWERSAPDSGHVIQIAGFNGNEARSYERDVRSGDYSMGIRTAFEVVRYYEMNGFERFVLADLNGTYQYHDTSYRGSKDREGFGVYHIEQVETRFGREAFVVSIRANGALAAEVVVTGPPEYLVCDLKFFSHADPSQVEMHREVTSVGELAGVLYPKSGSVREEGYGLVPAFEYDFEVTNVTKIVDTQPDKWFPPWPSGTAINDQIDNRVAVVPFSAQEARETELRARRVDVESSWTFSRVFFWIGNGVLMGALIIAILRARRAS